MDHVRRVINLVLDAGVIYSAHSRLHVSLHVVRAFVVFVRKYRDYVNQMMLLGGGPHCWTPDLLFMYFYAVLLL